MTECPKCHQMVDSRALECPYCRTLLKAHGHPGMKLYRSLGDEPLCLTCVYHEDDSCNFPKRPYAMDCTLYSDRTRSLPPETPGFSPSFRLKTWFSRYGTWVALLGLLLVSLLVALVR